MCLILTSKPVQHSQATKTQRSCRFWAISSRMYVQHFVEVSVRHCLMLCFKQYASQFGIYRLNLWIRIQLSSSHVELSSLLKNLNMSESFEVINKYIPKMILGVVLSFTFFPIPFGKGFPQKKIFFWSAWNHQLAISIFLVCPVVKGLCAPKSWLCRCLFLCLRNPGLGTNLPKSYPTNQHTSHKTLENSWKLYSNSLPFASFCPNYISHTGSIPLLSQKKHPPVQKKHTHIIKQQKNHGTPIGCSRARQVTRSPPSMIPWSPPR